MYNAASKLQENVASRQTFAAHVHMPHPCGGFDLTFRHAEHAEDDSVSSPTLADPYLFRIVMVMQGS